MIFVDTSLFVAAVATRDAHHEDARLLISRFASAGLLTSNQVRGETWTFLNRRYGHRVAVAFLDMLERTSLVELAGVDDELEAQALRWLRRHDEREYSFVDATSFALMRSRRITEAMTFDQDFAAAGFTTVVAGERR